MQYADGGKFWKGKVPPSSTAPTSGMAQARMNRAMNAEKVRREGGVKAEDGSMVPKSFYNKSTPRGQMANKTTGLARAKEVASSSAKGLFGMTKVGKVKMVADMIKRRRTGKKLGLVDDSSSQFRSKTRV